MPFEKAAAELSIPERKLSTLSFCEPTPRHMQQWVSQLPMVNLSEASRQLYHAIIELNQLVIGPEERLKLTEIIRPAILFACSALSRHYLNKPVFLPKNALKVSRLAAALTNQLAIAYKIIIFDIINGPNAISRKEKKILLVSIERALSCLADGILTSIQLYSAAPVNHWHQIHQLYLIAETRQILDIEISDKQRRYFDKSTIADTYKRILMLGCCRTNQLRQADIRQIYDATEWWAQHVVLEPIGENSEFALDPDDDKPPAHTHIMSVAKASSALYGIGFSRLLDYLNNHLVQSESNLDAYVKGITVPKTIGRDIVRHLISAWHSPTDRSHRRLPSNKPVTLSIGFKATHYRASGGIDFETQLQKNQGDYAIETGQEPGKAPSIFEGRDVVTIRDYKDVWADSFDAKNKDVKNDAAPITEAVEYHKQVTDGLADEEENKPALLSDGDNGGAGAITYHAQLVDASPTGYCVRWKDAIPQGIKAGEAISINESMGHIWSAGVIRWIRQISSTESLMGVELFAPGAIPCGAKVITLQKKKSDYMRALLIPASPSIQQPASLITPNLPFKQGLRVILNQWGELTHGRLSRRIALLGNFSQFVFDLDEQSSQRGDDADNNVEDIWPDV